MNRPSIDHDEQPQAAVMRILFADDDPVSRLLTTRLLQIHGHRVHTVSDGAEAVAAAVRHVFDVVLLDIRMPVMGGLEAGEQLRNRGFTGPIVGLTGSVKSVAVTDYVAAGMLGCLPKPLDHHMLVTLLEADAPSTDPEVIVEPNGHLESVGIDAALSGI